VRKILLILGASVLIIACSMTKSKINNTHNRSFQDDNFIFNKANIELVERSLNVKELEGYLHLEQQNRLPLTLTYKRLKKDTQYVVSCFSHPVKIVQTKGDDYQGSVIELFYAYQDADKTKLIFRYPIEGVKFTVEFELQDNEFWEIYSEKIVEY